MNPLPAAEVRRRGNRIRRRNNAIATVGGLAVTAIIVTPFALANSVGTQFEQQAPIAKQPTKQWITTIPSNFPLGADMGTVEDPPHVGHELGDVVFSTIAVCGREVWTPEALGSTDALGAVWSDGIEGGNQRTLALYPTDREATDALTVIRQAVRACPDQAVARGDYIQPIELSASAGDDALAYMEQYGAEGQPTGEANAYVVTRVSNALLLDKTYFGGGGSPQVAQQTADLLQTRSVSVVDAMCVLTGAPCGELPKPAESRFTQMDT